MPTLNEKLAQSLTALRRLSRNGQRRVFETRELGRADRELLQAQGFLKEIMNGWVMVTRPSERPGESTSWYASFWEFCRQYLDHRFKSDWILSPENSLSLLAENLNVPRQIFVQAPTANNRPVDLPHGTSIYAYRMELPRYEPAKAAGLRIYPAPEALVEAAPHTWVGQTSDVVAVLGSVREAELLRPLLDRGRVASAGRIAGACRILGRPGIADTIVRTMKQAGHVVREEADPFEVPVPMKFQGVRPVQPVVTRIRLLWATMRDDVLASFTEEPKLINDREGYMHTVDENYVSDAYHSLSIEGYHVSEELIERVRRGDYDPENEEADRQQKDAMAAKGYWIAFQEVRDAVERVLNGDEAAEIAEAKHLDWFRALFQPSVAAGLLKPENLAGYRTHFVFLRDSSHVPVAWQVVPDAMEAFFECLLNEEDPRVRAVLGHYVFTFIHPLPDGNGRCGRFLLNLMLASGGYPWTILPVDRRDDYMAALDAASSREDIKPFASLVAECVGLVPPPPRRLRRDEVQEHRPEAAPASRPHT